MPVETRLVTIDQKSLADLQAMLGNGKNFPKAMQAAISRTLDPTAVKMFSDRVKDTINLPVREIKKQVTVKKPSFTKLEGTISMSRKPVPLIKYMSAGQIRRASALKLKKTGAQTRFRSTRVSGGITVRVRRNAAPERYPSGFVERSKRGGYLGVFHRRRKGSGLVKRYPIRLMQGPTAVGVLAGAPGKGAATIIDEITQQLGPVLQKNILSQVSRLLNNEKSFK